MSSMSSYGTLATNSYALTFAPNTSTDRPKTPAGLIVTQAVQTKDGWLGQVIVDKEIVWESDAFRGGDRAIDAANRRVVEVVKTLFGWTPPAEEAS